MAVKRPLCNYLGTVKELAVSDSLPGGSGFVFTEVAVDLGITPLKSGIFYIITGDVLVEGAPVIVQQAISVYQGKGSFNDEAEMDHISAIGYVVSSTEIQVNWVCRTYVSGFFNFKYAVVG